MSEGRGSYDERACAGASRDGWGRPSHEDLSPSRRQLGAFLIQIALAAFLIWKDPFGLSRASARYSELLAGAMLGDRLLPAAAAEGSAARDRMAVVLLDEITLRCLGYSWPPPYRLHAEILNKIKQYKPKAVFIDFTFDVPRDRLKSGPFDDTFTDLIEELKADPPPFGYFMAAGAQSCGVWEALRGDRRKKTTAASYCPLARGVHEDFLAAGVTPVQARQGSDYDELGDYPLWFEADAVPRDRFLRRHVLEAALGKGQPAVEELLCRVRGAAARWSAATAIHKALTGDRRPLPAGDTPQTMRVLWRADPAPPPRPSPFCPGALPAGLHEAIVAQDADGRPSDSGVPAGLAAASAGAPAASCTAAPRGLRGLLASAWSLAWGGLAGVRQECPHFPTVYASTLLYGEEGSQGDGARTVLEDRVVFYGGDIDAIRDATLSPAHGQIPGVYLHAAALENLLVLGPKNYKSTDRRLGPAGYDVLPAGNTLEWGVVVVLAALGAVAVRLHGRARRLSWRLGIPIIWGFVVSVLVAVAAWFGFSVLRLGVVDVIGLVSIGLAGPPLADGFYATLAAFWLLSRRAWSTIKGDY